MGGRTDHVFYRARFHCRLGASKVNIGPCTIPKLVHNYMSHRRATSECGVIATPPRPSFVKKFALRTKKSIRRATRRVWSTSGTPSHKLEREEVAREHCIDTQL